MLLSKYMHPPLIRRQASESSQAYTLCELLQVEQCLVNAQAFRNVFGTLVADAVLADAASVRKSRARKTETERVCVRARDGRRGSKSCSLEAADRCIPLQAVGQEASALVCETNVAQAAREIQRGRTEVRRESTNTLLIHIMGKNQRKAREKHAVASLIEPRQTKSALTKAK